MEKTTNYQLNKPEAADPIRMDDFNENADKIDAALGGLAKYNPPWVFGTLDLTGVEEGDVVATFDFAPAAILLAADSNIPGFTSNGGKCTVRKHTSSGYHTFLLSGNTLTVTAINNEPTTTIQYLLLK